MFEPSFLCILKQIEEKYGQDGKEMALHIHEQKIFEIISQMDEADFIRFRDIVDTNLAEVKNLFREIYRNLAEINADNYHNLIPKKVLNCMDTYYQYYYTELDNFLSNYLLNKEEKLKLYSEIYEKFEISFQQFCEQISMIFSRKDYLALEFDNPYSNEGKILSLKQDLEKMLSEKEEGIIILSKEELFRIIQIFNDTDNLGSNFYKQDLENLRILIDDIKEKYESRCDYSNKVKEVISYNYNHNYIRACDIANDNFRIFLEEKQWKCLEDTYRAIFSLVEEGLEHISDHVVCKILSEMKEKLNISLDPIDKKKLYQFYKNDLLKYKFSSLLDSLVDYSRKQITNDVDLIADRLDKMMMPLGLISQADIQAVASYFDVNKILELFSLYNKRFQVYQLYSNPNSDKLIQRLQNGEYDSLYDTILERLQGEDYFTMLVTIPPNSFDMYLDIYSMLDSGRSIREEDCMESIFKFANQKVKTLHKN